MKKTCFQTLTVLLLTCSGCSFSSSPDNGTLAKELHAIGAVQLNPDNPYLAGNLFLSEETQSSDELRGFLELKGLPEALEITRLEENALDMLFRYESEAYSLRKRDGRWIILDTQSSSHSKLDTPETPSPASQTAPIGKASETSILRKADSSNETPEPRRDKTREAISPAKTKQHSEVSVNTGNFVLHKSGDVIHRVSYQGETLRFIVGWYTGDVENLDRIIRINDIRSPNVLKMGQVVRIPRYLLTNPQAVTQSDVEAYREGKF